MQVVEYKALIYRFFNVKGEPPVTRAASLLTPKRQNSFNPLIK